MEYTQARRYPGEATDCSEQLQRVNDVLDEFTRCKGSLLTVRFRHWTAVREEGGKTLTPGDLVFQHT